MSENTENITTKFNVDISDLKKNITEAKRRIRLINAQFREATAGMDKWSDSADGLSAKITQMNGIIEQEKKKLESLEKQYDMVAEAEGKDSKAAEDLLIRITNQRAAVTKAAASLEKYNQHLTEMRREQKESASSSEKQQSKLEELRQRIKDQENDLTKLKEEYKNTTLQFGKTSSKAKDLASDISKLSKNLADGKKELEDLDKSTDSLDQSLKDVDEAAQKSGDGFTTMKGAMADLIADGIRKLAEEAKDALKDIIAENEKAYNSFQAQTGATSSSMAEYKKQIDELYKSNFGDSMNDVASAMAEVKQQTGEMDPSKLKEMTENAITMRDTFGYDIKEQFRAVDMLVDQFGISTEEAYNLLIQGTQKGLDKNGDLLDTINEYGVHYKQMGYSAEEFFNSLESGTEAGTFSVDKLGDAMKEFGIRTKDTATTSQEGFQLLGYGANTSKEQLAKTKEEIAKLEKNLKYAKMEQEGFNSKTSELTRMKNADKIKEYSDKLAEAKEQLKQTKNASKDSAGSVKDLQKRFAKGGETAKKATQEVLKKLMAMDDKVKQNQVGVDLFGTMWEDLGIEGVKALMDTNGTMDMTKKSMEEIKKIKYDDVCSKYQEIGRTVEQELLVPLAQKAIPTIEKVANFAINHIDMMKNGIKIAAVSFGTVFAARKISSLVSTIKNVATVFVTLKTAITGATVAQEGLNIAQAASPIGAVITGVVGLVGVIGTLTAASSIAGEATDELTKEEEEQKKKVDELADSYAEMKEAREKSVSETESQFEYYKELKSELDSLIDKNGKVKDGYKDRVDFIINELNDALGTELKRTGDIVQNYQNEKKALNDLIETQKARITLENEETNYEEAKNKRKEARNELLKAQDEYNEALKETNNYEEYRNKLEKEGVEAYTKRIGFQGNAQEKQKAYNIELETSKKHLKDLQKAEKNKKNEMNKAQATYTGYIATIHNYEALSEAIISGKPKKIKKALQNVENSFVTAKDGTKDILEQQVKDMQASYEEMQKAVDRGLVDASDEEVKETKEMVKRAERELEKFENGAEKSGKKTGKAAKKGLESADTKSVGKKQTKDYKEGLELGKNKAGKTAKQIGKVVKKRLEETKTESSGKNFVQGLIDGLKSDEKNTSLIGAVTKVANTALETLKKRLDEHSPSRKTKPMGAFFTEGFAGGIVGAVKAAERAVELLTARSLKKLKEANKNGNYEKAGSTVVSMYEKGIAKQEKAAEKAVKSLVNKTIAQAKKESKSDKAKKSFSDLGTKLIDSFSDAFSKAADKATEKAKNKIEKLTAATQEKYDTIKDLQDDLESRLSEGELFAEDDNGNVALTDFSSETAKIIQFGKNMEQLKKKLSSELMTEIAGLSVEDGMKLTSKLLSLSDSELAAYNKAYTDKLNASKNVASKYYEKQIKAVKDQYSKKLTKVMGDLEKQLNQIGENAMKGFLKGLSSKDKDMQKEVKKIKDSLVKSIKKELDIHSPSGVMEKEAGVYVVPGIAKGITKKLYLLKEAMNQVSDQITTPMKAAMSNVRLEGAVSGGYNAYAGSSQMITNNTNNFYQTNNSPKALSRWDIYRQSKNMLEGVMARV